MLGVATIVAGVLGAGYMMVSFGETGALGLGLIALAVAGILFVVISIFGPISGAHLNPAVTLVFWLRKSIDSVQALAYLGFQFLGALIGAMTANLMFEKPILLASETERTGYGQLLGELVATFGLVLMILLLIEHNMVSLIAPGAALWIAAGHLFTSSTSFANPAVTVGRALSDSLSSIAWPSVPGFILFQVLGALIALIVFQIIRPKTQGE
jgi:glycerol uptake facilitator-like aquaporin